MRKSTPRRHNAKLYYDTKVQSIDSHDFAPRTEAKAFVGFVFRGQMTFEQARQSILMAPEQLAWLIRHKMGEERALRKIFEKRLMTWEAFEGMYRQATAVKISYTQHFVRGVLA